MSERLDEAVERPDDPESQVEAAREPAAFKPLQTWTRLRPRELAPMPNMEALLGIGPAISLGHGLLWPGSFQEYAMGWMPGMNIAGVALGLAEFGRLLRDQRVNLDYAARSRVCELACGRGALGIDFPSFLGLVEETARKATFAEDLSASEPWRRNTARSKNGPDEVALRVLRAVFNSYDVGRRGELAREDYMRLLRDRGQVPRTPEEVSDLRRQLAFCREDGLPGALDFTAFLRFLVFLSGR